MVLFSTVAVADRYCDKGIPYLKQITSSDPKEDALFSVMIGNTKYYAVYGYSFRIPGFSYEEQELILATNNYKVIEGSGDNLCSWEGAPDDLWRAIDNYAKSYNEAIAKYASGS